MREQFSTNAINLKHYNISESDRLIIMYSKEKGIIKGIAKGAKKANSKLGGRMDLLVANRMMLSKGRNIDTICQAEALNTFFNLRSDINKLFYAMYCAEIVANFGAENDLNSEEIYNLFYIFLEKMSQAKTKEQIMLYVIRFQLKIMNITGYSIELKKCVRCQKEHDENIIYFSIENGGTLCSACIQNISKKISIHKKIVEFLDVLAVEDFSQVTRYDDLATEKICERCINLLKKYIEYYSPIRFKTSEILEGIM